MKPSDLTAILLCGGRGSRMGSLTDDIPKCLVKIKGKPILEHIVNHLIDQGVTDIIVCTGYKAAEVESRFRDGIRGYQLRFSNAGPDVSMTDRIIKARELFEGPALICYGDEWANIDLRDLDITATEAQFDTSMTVIPRSDGTFQNIGFVLLSEYALDHLEHGAGLYDWAIKSHELGLYIHHGKRWTVNCPEDIEAAERVMA